MNAGHDPGHAATALVDGLRGQEVLELPGADDSKLLVGGGPELFTVLAMIGPDAFFDVVGDAGAEDEVDVLIGGTRTPWPRRLCASREQAITAVEYWLTSGGLGPTLRWERQDSTRL